MSDSLNIDIITIFPHMLDGFLNESILKRAAQSGLVNIRTTQLRDFTDDNHRSVDDRPYGGGPGMVLMPEPIFKAVDTVRTEAARTIMMTPQGVPFNQQRAADLATENHLIFITGHYEGFDERVRTGLVTDEISIGDYVLTNGVLSAAVVIDAVVRLRPGVLGDDESSRQDSFSHGLLEGPQYTRPADFRGMPVPDILLSGDHGRIAAWREEQALQRTRERRPDLLGDEVS
ncbi:MAG: tRNA (guanosine(37)-N1)-methyltransferase TrmD [Verrucomicrobiota bacterium]